MEVLRSRRSERKSSRVWCRNGSAERYAAGWKSGERKSERGSAAGKGRGRSPVELLRSDVEEAEEDGRSKAAVVDGPRLGFNERGAWVAIVRLALRLFNYDVKHVWRELECLLRQEDCRFAHVHLRNSGGN